MHPGAATIAMLRKSHLEAGAKVSALSTDIDSVTHKRFISL